MASRSPPSSVSGPPPAGGPLAALMARAHTRARAADVPFSVSRVLRALCEWPAGGRAAGGGGTDARLATRALGAPRPSGCGRPARAAGGANGRRSTVGARALLCAMVRNRGPKSKTPPFCAHHFSARALPRRACSHAPRLLSPPCEASFCAERCGSLAIAQRRECAVAATAAAAPPPARRPLPRAILAAGETAQG